MARITVIPERLRSLSTQLSQTAQELTALEGRLNSTMSGLDWEARQKAGIDNEVAQIRSQGRALAERAAGLARYVADKAEAFETADRQSASALDDLIKQHPTPAPAPVPTPAPPIGRVHVPALPTRPNAPTMAQLGRTVLALHPLVTDAMATALGLEPAKFAYDYGQAVAAYEHWAQLADKQPNSPETEAALNEFYKQFVAGVPGVGTFWDVLCKMAEANPVE